MLGNEGYFVAVGMWRQISNGAAFARSKLTAAISSLWQDISVQFSGMEMMDSRQYRQT